MEIAVIAVAIVTITATSSWLLLMRRRSRRQQLIEYGTCQPDIDVDPHVVTLLRERSTRNNGRS